MSYYIRKISRAKWPEDVSGVEVKDVRADAITGCMRTTSDELSLWKVDKIGNPEEDVLPIITGFEKPNRCEIVYIDEQLFIDQGIEVVQEKGNTPLKELADTHYEAFVKNYDGLGKFAKVILNSLKNDGNFVKISDRQVKNIIKRLVESGRISSEQLNDTMQEKLGYVKVGDSRG